MSNINYDVWGTPDTWGRGSWTPTNGPLPFIRVGAANYSDNDFTEYPTVLYPRKSQLWLMYNEGYLNINEFIDESLAYTAMANPDLPQLNQYVFDNTHTTLANPVAYTDNSRPLPFSLSMYYTDVNAPNPDIVGTLSGLDGFPDNATVIGSQQLWRIAPFAYQGATYNTTLYNYNPNTHIVPFASFGIKSIILEINVCYRDSDNETHTTTLKSYLNNTSDWLHNHPLIRAWCVPYFRTNKNGSYTSSLSVTGATVNTNSKSLTPLFYQKYKCGSYDVQILTGNGYCIFGGWFPIYGSQVADGAHVYANTSYNITNNPNSTNVNARPLIYGANKGTLRVTGATYSLTAWIDLDMSIAENVEYIMKGAAAYGLFFCTDIGTLGNSGRDTGPTERWIDNDMYLGIIRSDGMTYGDYTRGTANKDQLQYEWKDSTETPYVPGQYTNDYSQQTRIRSIGHIDTMTDRYVLNSTAVNALSVDLFGIMSDLSEQSTNWSDLFAKTIDNFLVQNPIDCIISLKKYPVKEIPNTGTLTNIHYGRYSTGSAAGYPCTADVYTYAFQPKHIQPRFENSFLDYEPYTSAELYIPYCGSVSLKMCDILGKQLQPFLCVDYHTGQCTGFVMCDGIVIETIQGTIAVDVPVTGIQTATVESQLMNAANSARQIRVNQAAGMAKAGLIVGAATLASPAAGAVALATQIKGTVNNQLQRNMADYNLSHTDAPQHVIGTSSSACGWIIDSDTARLILYYPAGDVITNDNPPEFDSAKLAAFGAKSGFATVETGTLSSYTGFTSGDILTDGINATDTEKDIIKSLFATGIYL